MTYALHRLQRLLQPEAPSDEAAQEHSGQASADPVGSEDGDTAADDERVPGGWNTRDPADEYIVAAAGEAVALLKERQQDSTIAITEVVSAQTQVVAGTNFRLRLSIETAEGAKTVELVMYRNLKKEVSLTSVEGL